MTTTTPPDIASMSRFSVTSDEDSSCIIISIIDAFNDETLFRVRLDSPVWGVIEHYAKGKDIEPDSLLVSYEGERIPAHTTMTIRDLNIRPYDRILAIHYVEPIDSARP